MTCENCGTEGPTELWGGTHDGTSLARNPSLARPWCRLCCLRAQIAYMRSLLPRLAEAEKELARLTEHLQPGGPAA